MQQEDSRPHFVAVQEGLTYCNGPHARRVWTPACGLHASCPPRAVDLGGRIAPVSRPLPVSLLPPSPSQLLSVLLCTLPLGLTAMSNSTRQSDKAWSLLVLSFYPPKTGVPRHACRRLSCLPQPSSNLFLSTIVLQRPRASGLGIGATIFAVHVDIQNKPPIDGLPPFPNRTRLSCATNLNITRLISQARDLKPAVGSPSSVLPVHRFTLRFWGASSLNKPNCVVFVLF